MARTVREIALDTRTARARLKPGKKPYWRTVDKGCHIGYFKGEHGGAWIARYFHGEGRYSQTRLAKADDVQDADGATILDFSQAQRKARDWYSAQASMDAGEGHRGPYTVQNAYNDYLKWFKANRRSGHELASMAEAHILPRLGSVQVAKLTTGRLNAWLDAVASAPRRKRTKQGEAPAFHEWDPSPEAMRRRRVTANHILVYFKAMLNFAWRQGKVASDNAWRRVLPYRGVDRARVRFLTIAECVRLVQACDAEFRPMVQAALVTGCRYGELTRLRVGDFNPDVGQLHLAVTKSGKPRNVILAPEGLEFFRYITADRLADEFTLRKRNGKPWKESEQGRRMREACKKANISPAVSFHILRHTYASLLVMGDAPMQIVAMNLGHADTRITEKHYAHLAPSFAATVIRERTPTLGILSGNVAGLLPPPAVKVG